MFKIIGKLREVVKFYKKIPLDQLPQNHHFVRVYFPGNHLKDAIRY